MDQDVNPQTVNPSTYNEHHPNMQAPTPQHPNPENEPSVFGPFGTTEWLDQLERRFRSGEITSISGKGQQVAVQGGQGQSQGQSTQSQSGQSPHGQQLQQAVQQLFQRGDITAIRCTPQKLFVVETKDGVTYESPSLRAALQQIPGLDLSQPFSLQGQQSTSTQNPSGQQASRSGQPQTPPSQTTQRSAQPGTTGPGSQGRMNPNANPPTEPQSNQTPPNLPPR